MDPTATSAQKAESEISTWRLDSAPTTILMAAAVAPHVAVPANDLGRQPAVWRSLQTIYPTAQHVFSEAGISGFVKRLRLSTRALLHLKVWRQWHGFLAESPFGRITRFYPRLYEKPFRPYLHKGLKSRERCEILLQHYLFMSRYAPEALIESLLDNRPFLLNEQTLGELAEPLAINLTYAKHMQQEGELTLSVGRLASLDSFQQHAWIASLTFTIRQGKDGWEIVVGGVQGGHAETGKEDAKLATSVFHGLRPKPLLIHVLREIATCWDVSRIYGIRNASHCLTRKRYRGRITIKSSYDELWQEAGGQVTGDGYYELPVRQARRSMESVPSRKRAQYQRRFHLLDGIDAEIRTKLLPKTV